MRGKKKGTRNPSVDPDDAPELTQEWFEQADLCHGDKLIRPGRPKSPLRKQAVSLRLDPEVLSYFRKKGPGWQSRINQALRKAAGLRG